MIHLQPNEYLMIAAMLGALFYMVAGWLDKKQKEPETEFEYAYITKTLIMIMGSGLIFEQVEIVQLTLGALLFAFLSGMGGNRAISKGLK